MDNKTLGKFLLQENEFDHSVLDALEGFQNINEVIDRTLEVQRIKTTAAIGLATAALGISIFLAVRR